MARSDRTIAVVTDSTADVPRALADELGIVVVPLSVTIAGETLPDLVLTQAEFFERMSAAPQLPTTSQPSVGAFVEAYKAALEQYDEVVSVHISSKLSGTYESASQAAALVGERVHVFDSRTLSFALGFQAVIAARAANAGEDVDGILRVLEDARDRVQIYVGVERLDNLAKGGRIGKVAAFLGGMLDLKVSFTVEDGSFAPVGRDRGPKAAVERTLRWVDEHMKGESRGRFCVMHANAPDKAEQLRAALQSKYEIIEMHVVETGTVIAAHTGTGWGVSFIPGE